MRKSSAAAAAAAAAGLFPSSSRARPKILPLRVPMTWTLLLQLCFAHWTTTTAAAAAAVATATEAVAAKCFGPLALCGVSSPCERGHYCANGVKFPCPGGRFGASSSESNPLCSDPCPAGFFCPEGSSSPTPCGNSTAYCPAGSAASSIASAGNYTLGGASPSGRTAEAMCPKGRYCEQGVAVFCPPGTYGKAGGLKDAACSGPCPPGWFCPPGTIDPFSFACGGPEYYCPEGSGRRLPVDRGFYAGGIGIDRAGGEGGYSFQTRCPIGRYCVEGVSFACPPGRFGASQLSTNSSCTGPCREGHFCPPGSYRADQNVCQNASVFCPEGSAAPMEASEGFYTVQAGSGGGDRKPSQGFAAMRTAQVQCEPGFYCTGGVRRTCPPGFYGNLSGLSTPYCSGPCAAGHVCGAGATTPTERVCGGDGSTFCPEGSSAPTEASEGYYTLGSVVPAHYDTLVATAEGYLRNDTLSNITTTTTTRTAEALCEPGHWCDGGLRHLCDAGSFGNEFGLTSRNCSGFCNPGFLCGAGSMSAEGRPCGVSFRGSNWGIEKRFNDFVALQQGLAREFRDKDVGALPKRRFFNRFDPQFLAERSQALQAFLANALVKLPVTTSDSMLNFLEVTGHVDMGKPMDVGESADEDLAAEYEELEQKRLADLVQSFADRMIDSQSVKVESRDDAQVEEKRQRLLVACGGFRAHDDHLNSFFNDPIPKAMGANDVIDMYNAPLDMSVKEQHMLMDQTEQALSKHIPKPLIMNYPDGRSLVTHMDT